MTENDRIDVRVRKMRMKKEHWIASEIVRKEASRLAIQHQYFSPQWFAEFREYLHNSFSPFHGHLLKELCLIIAGSEACQYCIKRGREGCVLLSER
nr:hypothetical protein [Candidatus Njordarchaeum guaymaensis]